jgi:hypothetical protein
MAGVTAAASIADALKSQALAGVQESLFKNNEVLGNFGTPVPFTGGATINLKHHYGGNSSVTTYSEGDALGAPGSQSYITAQWPATYYRAQIQITGHAVDQLQNGVSSTAFYDQLGLEFTMVAEDLTDRVSTDCLGTGLVAPVGIQGIVDSAGTIAGLNRSTYSWFQAYEVSGGTTTVAISDLDGAAQNSGDADYAAQVDVIWTSWKQKNKLKGVMGQVGVAGNSYLQSPSGPLNTAGITSDMFYGNVPIKPIRDLTNSIFLGLTMSTFGLGMMRDWKVEPLAKTDDSNKYLVTGAWGLFNRNPKKNWKVTTLTA